MSLTQINIQSSKDFIQSDVEFNCECVIDETSVVGLYNIYWIEAGSAVIYIDFNKYKIESDSLFFIRPGQIFSVASENKLLGIRMAFDENFYCNETLGKEIGCRGLLFNDLISKPYIIIDEQNKTMIEELFANIDKCFSESELVRNELLSAYLKILLIRCTELKKEIYSDQNSEREETPEFLRKFNLLVEDKYSDWHSLAMYAEHFGISSKSLTKKLNKYHKKPSQIIYDRIITEAKRLLFFSDLSVKEIAYKLNFDDPSHFSKFFKINSGQNPSEFIKQKN